MSTQFANTFGTRAGRREPALDRIVNSDNNTRISSQKDNHALERKLYDSTLHHEVVHRRRDNEVRGLPRTTVTVKANDTLQSFSHLPRHLSSKPRHAPESHLKRTHNKWHA